MDMVNPGIWVSEPVDMVLSDVGMIAKKVEISYHRKGYPLGSFRVGRQTGKSETLFNLFESEFDQMRVATARALNVPLSFFNIS